MYILISVEKILKNWTELKKEHSSWDQAQLLLGQFYSWAGTATLKLIEYKPCLLSNDFCSLVVYFWRYPAGRNVELIPSVLTLHNSTDYSFTWYQKPFLVSMFYCTPILLIESTTIHIYSFEVQIIQIQFYYSFLNFFHSLYGLFLKNNSWQNKN